MLFRLKGLDVLRKDFSKLIRLNSSALSTISEPNQTQNEYEGARMSAWQVHSYGGLEELQFSKHVRMPIIRNQNEVLIRVISSSVNPIDVHMTNGYGNVVLNAFRQLETCSMAQDVELPLIMGRDFAGEVVAKGNGVTNLKVGDQVYGVVPVHQQGCHAQNVVVHCQYVRRKPDNVTVEEAASLLYASLTAWSALRVTGDLWLLPAETKKVLVIGGSGGVGTAAIQMLKAWGTEVTTTCSSDAVQLVESLNADHIIDYRRPDFIHELKSHGKFDIILDAAGLLEDDVPQYIGLLKEWSLAKFITLRSPVLRNTDKMGLVPGMLQNAVDLLVPNLASGALSKGSSFRWGFFMPVPPAMDEINSLVQTSKIRPLIQEKFSFSDLPVAYDRVKTGHLRGKVVVNIE